MEENIFRNALDEDRKVEAILASVFPKGGDQREAQASLAELERLVDTAGAHVFAQVVQQKEYPDKATCLGSGKIEELKALCENGGVKLVVFDCELSPSQIRNVEDAIGGDVRVIDRSMLILDIFALHATSADGKLQVELAQLKYTAPRLTGRGKAMSRLGGGIGTRGPGESKLEADRRRIRARIALLEDQLSELEKVRETQRRARERSGLYKFAIAGYTNAGKSTLLNYLTGAGILAEDKLFATLDPTTRKLTLPDGTDVLLTDTVGFIRNLPTHLIKAFRSTLDEVALSDAVLVLIDSSDPESDSQLGVTKGLLDDLGALGKPILYVLNKCDKSDALTLIRPGEAPSGDIAAISAKTGEGIDALLEKMQAIARSGKRDVVFNIPNSDLGIISALYAQATVKDVEYGECEAKVTATVDAKTYGRYKKYVEGAAENEDENEDGEDE